MIKSASFHSIIVRILKDYWHYLHQLTKLKNNFISYPVFYKKNSTNSTYIILYLYLTFI